MNAIISLCHFCEVHGPSVLFCTQPFHSGDPDGMNQDLNIVHEPEGARAPAEKESSLNPSDSKSSHTPASGSSTGTENQASNSPLPHTIQAQSSLSKSTEACEACRPLFGLSHPGFISNDLEAKVRYVTMQQPDHPQVFSMVRQACLRSLSCEVCPGREGPIFFGDETQGHVFSHTFFIKDSHARGLQRWYSITVIMMDRIFLLNSWPFLLTHIKNIIEDLQSKANVVYNEEQAQCPQRPLRLSTGMTTPANFRHHRGANKPSRSLAELTNDKLVFHRLHQRFTWILKAGGNRLTERLLEGPPTEDAVIDLEKQEENEDGFVVLHKLKDMALEQTEEGFANEDEEDDSEVPYFKSLRHVLKVIGYQRFHQLAHHAIIGNQVIIMCRQRKACRSLIDCLKTLLPRGCCRVIYHSKQYEDSWRCNFLGLAPGVPLPGHADLYVLVEIQEPQAYADGLQPPTDENFVGYSFRITSCNELPEKGPRILDRMEFALMNEKMADSVVDQCLISLKEEWMNKVKVLFKFTKAGGSRSEEDTRKLLRVVNAQDEDKVVLKFWMTGLSVQYRNHMLSSAISNTVA